MSFIERTPPTAHSDPEQRSNGQIRELVVTEAPGGTKTTNLVAVQNRTGLYDVYRVSPVYDQERTLVEGTNVGVSGMDRELIVGNQPSRSASGAFRAAEKVIGRQEGKDRSRIYRDYLRNKRKQTP